MRQGDSGVLVNGAALTKRQLEILLLIREGLSNKHIAARLDISLGTVKQHIALLFKKLNVQNRSMAVVIADKLIATQKKDVFSEQTPYLLARRPAVVLSFKFNVSSVKVYRRINTLLSDIAFDFYGHYIHHSAGCADLVFGLKRSSEQDIIAALIAVHKVAEFFRVLDLSEVQTDERHLSAAISVGSILVSQHRYGGWSGETVAGPVIANAHKLLSESISDGLAFCPDAKAMLFAFDFNLAQSDFWYFHQISENLCWYRLKELPIFGRQTEIDLVLQHLTSKEGSVCIFGESGMGKSKLCRELAKRLSSIYGYSIEYFKVLSSGYLDMTRGLYIDHFTDVTSQLAHYTPELDGSCKRVIVFDDVHLVSDDERDDFYRYVQQASVHGKVILSSRKSLSLYPVLETLSLKLSRLENDGAKALVSSFCLRPEQTTDVFHLSKNVPLFIKELSMNTASISTALMTVVASRLDTFNLDWKLLYLLSKCSGQALVNELAIDVGEPFDFSLNTAVYSGVLIVEGDIVRYKNPLVERVVSAFFSIDSES